MRNQLLTVYGLLAYERKQSKIVNIYMSRLKTIWRFAVVELIYLFVISIRYKLYNNY